MNKGDTYYLRYSRDEIEGVPFDAAWKLVVPPSAVGKEEDSPLSEYTAQYFIATEVNGLPYNYWQEFTSVAEATSSFRAMWKDGS